MILYQSALTRGTAKTVQARPMPRKRKQMSAEEMCIRDRLYILLTLSAPLWLHLFCTMSGIRLSEIILTAAAMAALPLTVLIWGCLLYTSRCV